MIKLYEVIFELENGQYLNVLMAAGSADEAKHSAADTLRNVTAPRKPGDSIRYCWRPYEITVREVSLAEIDAT